jgi:hypothetical protein
LGVLKERGPHFAGAGAAKEEVIGVLILRAEEACSRGPEAMPEAAFIGWEAPPHSKPAEDFALKGGSAFPHLLRHHVNLQVPERIGVDTFVRKLFVSETVPTRILGVAAKNHRAKLDSEASKVSFSGLRQVWFQRTAESRSQGCGDVDIHAGGVGEEVRELVLEGVVSEPEVRPKGRSFPIASGDFRYRPKSCEPSNNVFPDRGIEVVGISQVTARDPAISAAKPASPGGGGVRVEFGKEFGQKGRVLSTDGENTQPPAIFWGTDLVPGNFAVAAAARFLPSPEKGPTAFVNGFNNSGGEDTSPHGVSEHGSQDRVNKDQTSADREASTSPARQAHVTFRHDGGKVPKAELMHGKG